MKLDASTLEGGFERVLEEFAQGLGEDVRKAVAKGAETCRDALRDTAVPGDTGEYAKGWEMQMEPGSFFGYQAAVFNKAKPSLTHLLEEGHELFIHGKDTGRRAPAYPHISPAADTGMEAMEKELGR